MAKAKGKKICIIVSSLGIGGAERSSALLSELLHSLGQSVHLITVMDIIEYDYKGELFNLGAFKPRNDTIFNRLKRLNLLRNYLKKHEFDFIIDSRNRNGVIKEFILTQFIFPKRKTIYLVRSYNIKTYIVFSKIIARYIYNNAYKLVCVSQDIYDRLILEYKFTNVIIIQNPVNEIHILETENRSINDPYILFYGRINDEVKNVSLLIDAYANSDLPKLGITLKIMGDGDDVSKLKLKSKILEMSSNIEFLNFNKNPFPIVKKALFTVLSSRYEGFPRMILESLSLGVPVITVDCKSGPKELIKNGYNGLIVENHNPTALAEAMNSFCENEILYNTCKSNAIKSVEEFSLDKLALKWDRLLNEKNIV